MLKSVFNHQCWFRQGSVAIYWGIVSDSGLVKSYFVLWAWSSASSRLVKVEDEAAAPTGDPKSSPIFHPYCPWHIQSGTVPSTEREGEKVAWSSDGVRGVYLYFRLLWSWSGFQFSLLKQCNSPVFFRADEVKLGVPGFLPPQLTVPSSLLFTHTRGANNQRIKSVLESTLLHDTG